MIQSLIPVALGGAIGASVRYLTNVAALRLLGAGLPWATLIVNVVGSFLMGFLAAYLVQRDLMRLAPFAMTGVLGGFTTFSAFSLETVSLWQAGQTLVAGTYVAGSVGLSLAALMAGMAAARGILA